MPSAGELAVFCRPVVTAPALVRRDGRLAADGWLPDFVRLGELERHLGDGVIEAIAGAALEAGRLRKRERRRIMSYPLVIRLMLAMALMPDASYCEALARLAGLLADIPFALEWHIPTGKVVTEWRLLIPADVMEDLFWQAAGPLIGDGEPSAALLAGMTVCAADGMLVNLADTPENRAMFGSAGTADGSSPFPQLRVVALTARAGRAMLGAILGSSHAGEQTLLKRLARRRPDLFAGRVTCFDRNFPGHELITAILEASGHVVARVSATVALPLGPGGGWLPDGSRMTWLNAPSGKEEDRLPVRAAEHNAILPCGDGKEVSETCTVITTLLDHQAAPAPAVRDAYLTRWSASETTFGQDKMTIAGAGNRTSGPVLRSGTPRLVISEAWAWLTATQLVRASAAAALRSEAAAARALRRDDSARSAQTRNPSPPSGATQSAPSHPPRSRHRRRCKRSPPQRTPPPAPPCTPSTSPDGSATPSAPRKHARNSRTPPQPRQPSPGNPRSRCSHPASASPPPRTGPSGRRNRPARPGPWNRAPGPPRHAGSSHARTPETPPRKRTQEQTPNTGTGTPLDNLNT